MIIGLICGVDFDRIFATRFEIAFVEFAGVIETFLFILSSKLIVELFWERTIFAWSIGFRLENNGFSSDSYIFKALFVSPHNHIVLSEGDMLHLRKRGSRYSQSKYFDRGRQADRRGRSRRPCHRVHKHLWLNGHLRLQVRSDYLLWSVYPTHCRACGRERFWHCHCVRRQSRYRAHARLGSRPHECQWH